MSTKTFIASVIELADLLAIVSSSLGTILYRQVGRAIKDHLALSCLLINGQTCFKIFKV